VSWWRAEGNANDSIGGNNGTLHGKVSFASGEAGQAFLLDGIDGGQDGYISIPDSPSLHSLTTSITIEAWINVSQFPEGDWTAIVTKGDSSWRLHRYGETSQIAFGTSGLDNEDLSSMQNVDDGQWHHVAAVYDGATKYIYVDGNLDNWCPATGTIDQNSYPVCIGENAEQTGRLWNGLIDEVSIYNRALTASEIRTIYEAGSEGKCPGLAINSQWANQTAHISVSSFSSSQSTGGGKNVSFNITGPAGSSWNVYSSSDLKNWTFVSKVTLNTAGTVSFTVEVTSGVPQQFYRLEKVASQ
jgi:hypothetical protein